VEDRSRRRARLILIVGLFLALLAGGGTFMIASSGRQAGPTATQTVPVLVAARELPIRTQLAAADLRLVHYKEDTVPPSALRDPGEAVGRVLTQPVALGEAVLPSKFSVSAQQAWPVYPPGEAAKPDSPHYRAMSLSVPDNLAVGGAIQPGDIVDILYVLNYDPSRYLTSAGNRPNDFSSKIVLGPVSVLAKSATVYTIRTDATTAERIAYLQASGGSLQLLLRAGDDRRSAGTRGVTFPTVLREFGFPAPERVTP
jgi:Flp pilus assembly protein CpaB